MSFGSTSGRGFESAASPYVWGAILLITLAVWVWSHLDIKRLRREEEAEKAEKAEKPEKNRDGDDGPPPSR